MVKKAFQENARIPQPVEGLDADDDYNRPEILHFEPLNPVRPDHPDEVIFVRHWQRLAGAKNGVRGVSQSDIDFSSDMFTHKDDRLILHEIMGVLGKPTDRDARVATSFIHWLGLNNGRTFRDKAPNLEVPTWACNRSQACRALWIVENERAAFCNFGRVPRDYILERVEEVCGTPATTRDYEVLEQMVGWIGTDEGQKYLKNCEAEIRRHYKREREAQQAQREQAKLPTPAP